MNRVIYLGSEYAAVSEDGRLTEYLAVSDGDRTGDILLGRVERIMSGLQSAFVDIGRKRSAFLPLKENSRTFQGSPLRSGDLIAVQIRKEEHGEKGAFLSRDLTLPGRYVLLMPLNRHIGVSARIADAGERERLRKLGEEIAAGRFGLVMRQACENADRATVTEEVNRLFQKWASAPAAGKCGTVLIPGNSAETELIQDYEPRGIQAIHRDEELPADLKKQLKDASLRTCKLPHGGSLVIDRCEALTVIDVNSGSDNGESGRKETFMRTNLEACREIAVQTRLRNLSGILILDMIDMEDQEDRDRVREELRSWFVCDRIKTPVCSRKWGCLRHRNVKRLILSFSTPAVCGKMRNGVHWETLHG